MRKRVRTERLLALLVAGGILLGTPCTGTGQSSVQDLPVDDALSVLDMLANQTLENYSKLASFKAEYAIEDTSIMREDKLRALRYEIPDSPGPWRKRDTGIVRLRFDAVKDCIFSEIQIHQCVLDQDVNGKSIRHPLPLPEPQRAIVTPSHFYYFRYNSRYADFREVPSITGKVGRVAMRKPLEEAERQAHATVVDARDFFGYGDFFWELLERIEETLRKDMEGELQKPAGVTEPVIRVQSFGGTGQEYRVSVMLWRSLAGSGAGRIRLVLRFGKSVGYNCTAVGVVGESGTDVEMNGWVYRTIKGIFIPSKMSRVLIDPKKGQPTNKRVLVLKSCRANEGIDDAELSLTALGLSNGERVMDYVEEKCYEYKDGKVVNPISFGAPRPSSVLTVVAASIPLMAACGIACAISSLQMLPGAKQRQHTRHPE